MIGLFKHKTPATIVLLLIFGLLIKLPLFLFPRPLQFTVDDGILYKYLFQSFTTGNPFFCSITAFLLLYMQALVATFITNENRLMTKQTFLPGMSYLLITSFLPEWNYLSAALVATTLMMWSCSRLFKLYNVPYAGGSIYNIGLIIGISSMIFFPSVFLAVCILLGLLILRSFRFNELLLFLLGIITPYYFYAVSLFLTDQLILQDLVPAIGIQLPQPISSLWLIAGIILLGVPFIAGGFYIQTQLGKMLIQARKNWAIFLFYLLFALIISFFSNYSSFQN
ncbi:MAG: hypothetical protein ABR502_01620 [Chitinophagaceae bacterium]